MHLTKDSVISANVEGRNIIVEYRYAEGRQDLATELAAEFVRLKVALIVATTTPGILAIKTASGTSPLDV